MKCRPDTCRSAHRAHGKYDLVLENPVHSWHARIRQPLHLLAHAGRAASHACPASHPRHARKGEGMLANEGWNTGTHQHIGRRHALFSPSGRRLAAQSQQILKILHSQRLHPACSPVPEVRAPLRQWPFVHDFTLTMRHSQILRHSADTHFRLGKSGQHYPSLLETQQGKHEATIACIST